MASEVPDGFLQTNKGAHIHKTATLVEPSFVTIGGKVRDVADRHASPASDSSFSALLGKKQNLMQAALP